LYFSIFTDKDKSHPAATKSSAPVLGKEERKNEDSSSGPIKGDRSSTEKELTGKKGSYGHGPDKVKEKEKHCPILHPPTPTPARASLTGEPKVIKKGDQVITSYVDEKTGKITVYEPGIKLEVSDFAGNWYPARVVDVDAEDQEILVHFENWSARFDEWIKMDSNRIRPSPNTNVVK
jgi:PHD finger protein 20